MFRFIDLFAGLGGFHLALSKLGGHCVFASELDDVLRDTYEANFGIRPIGDIRRVSPRSIPEHEVLCAGFPCQSFSKAGTQEGLECERNGDLVDYVQEIIRKKKPRVFMLENVPNLLKHDGGATWRRIHAELGRDYEVAYNVLSPHDFGIPQVRDRVFIVGGRRSVGGLGRFKFPTANGQEPDLRTVLQSNPADARPLPEYLVDAINVWNEFVRQFPKKRELPSFPIWAMEFGATYPTDGPPPLKRTLRSLRRYRGIFGASLENVRTFSELGALLPHHALVEDEFPMWKQTFIRQNRELWTSNATWLRDWIPSIARFPHSLQKLEWNCKGCERDLWKYVLQVRASGIRAKRPTTAPSLIAMTTTQVPIVGWERRYMTARECAELQSLDDLQVLPSASTRAYKALGNAVNARLAMMIAEKLLQSAGLRVNKSVVQHTYSSGRAV